MEVAPQVEQLQDEGWKLNFTQQLHLEPAVMVSTSLFFFKLENMCLPLPEWVESLKTWDRWTCKHSAHHLIHFGVDGFSHETRLCVSTAAVMWSSNLMSCCLSPCKLVLCRTSHQALTIFLLGKQRADWSAMKIMNDQLTPIFLILFARLSDCVIDPLSHSCERFVTGTATPWRIQKRLAAGGKMHEARQLQMCKGTPQWGCFMRRRGRQIAALRAEMVQGLG